MTKVLKVLKDYLAKATSDRNLHPKGLFELSEYMRHNSGIQFEYHTNEDGSITAVSKNFRHGSIITQAKDMSELDKNIKDAILTSFEIPSSYATEAQIIRVGNEQKEYALA